MYNQVPGWLLKIQQQHYNKETHITAAAADGWLQRGEEQDDDDAAMLNI